MVWWQATAYAANHTFHHVAVVRSSGVVRVYVNGVDGNPAGPWNTTADFTHTAYTFGGSPYTSHSGQFWLDDYRVTIGVARYTANFTPPAAAFLDK